MWQCESSSFKKDDESKHLNAGVHVFTNNPWPLWNLCLAHLLSLLILQCVSFPFYTLNNSFHILWHGPVGCCSFVSVFVDVQLNSPQTSVLPVKLPLMKNLVSTSYLQWVYFDQTHELIVTPTAPFLNRKLCMHDKDVISPAAGSVWCIHTTTNTTGTLAVLLQTQAVSQSVVRLLTCTCGRAISCKCKVTALLLNSKRQ